MPMHLQKIPATTQRSLITLVPNGLIRTAFPFISFDPAPSPKKPAYAESLATSTRPQPDPMFAPPTPMADATPTSICTSPPLLSRGNHPRPLRDRPALGVGRSLNARASRRCSRRRASRLWHGSPGGVRRVGGWAAPSSRTGGPRSASAPVGIATRERPERWGTLRPRCPTHPPLLPAPRKAPWVWRAPSRPRARSVPFRAPGRSRRYGAPHPNFQFDAPSRGGRRARHVRARVARTASGRDRAAVRGRRGERVRCRHPGGASRPALRRARGS